MGPVSGAPEWKARPESPEYEATRRRLVDAAEEIVREKGVRGLRLDSVADAVGLHRSSVYRYVDSKEDLVTAVVIQATVRLGRRVIDQLGEDAPPETFLVEGVVIALTAMVDDPVYRSLVDPAASEAVARVGGRALTEGMRPLVEPMLAAAAEQGVLRPDVTPDDAIRWLQVVTSGLLRQAGTFTDRDELTRLLERMLVPALLAR